MKQITLDTLTLFSYHNLCIAIYIIVLFFYFLYKLLVINNNLKKYVKNRA